MLPLGHQLIIDGIRGAHSEYHWLPPNRERSCHIVSSSSGAGGLPLACPQDAEDAHTAIFVFVVVMFAVVFIGTIFVLVIRGRQVWGTRGRKMDATSPPSTPPPLDDDNAPPPSPQGATGSRGGGRGIRGS